MDSKTINNLSGCKKLDKFIQMYKTSGDIRLMPIINDIEEYLVNNIEIDYGEDDKVRLSAAGYNDIVFCGYAGLSGSLLMADHARELLNRRLTNAYIDRIDQYRKFVYEDKSLIENIKDDISIKQLACIPVSEGGLYKTLFDLGKKYNRGFLVEYSKVPMKQETIEFCECFEMDPWQLFSAGSIFFLTDNGIALQKKLEDRGIVCQIVGHFHDQNDKTIRFRDEDRLLNRPDPEELLKILKEKIKAD